MWLLMPLRSSASTMLTSSKYSLYQQWLHIKALEYGFFKNVIPKHEIDGHSRISSQELVRRYSEFISFPIYLWVTKETKTEVPVDEEVEAEEDKEENMSNLNLLRSSVGLGFNLGSIQVELWVSLTVIKLHVTRRRKKFWPRRRIIWKTSSNFQEMGMEASRMKTFRNFQARIRSSKSQYDEL